MPVSGDVRSPDFFIVGAARSGTTSLYQSLRRHPNVFMPENKEPHFFGTDLRRQHTPMNREEYLALFEDAHRGQRVGEASPLYLYSATAAREIREFAPNAQVIVMLRKPVDLIYSLYQQNYFLTFEDLPHFGEALAAESARRGGSRVPNSVRAIDALFYRDVGRLADQLERYLVTFPAGQVHITVFDDLQADSQAVFAGVARFLGIDERRLPRVRIVNESRAARIRQIQQLVVHPPPPADRLAARLRRYPWAHRLRSWLLSTNSKPAPRAPLDPDLERQLTREFASQVTRLETLIGRDLTAWRAA
jgi:sulfotransferase family protein